jgi:hypothetical protein
LLWHRVLRAAELKRDPPSRVPSHPRVIESAEIPEISGDAWTRRSHASNFFAEFGSDTTTFVLSTELHLVNLLTSGHGLSTGIARVGAFMASSQDWFPPVRHRSRARSYRWSRQARPVRPAPGCGFPEYLQSMPGLAHSHWTPCALPKLWSSGRYAPSSPCGRLAANRSNQWRTWRDSNPRHPVARFSTRGSGMFAEVRDSRRQAKVGPWRGSGARHSWPCSAAVSQRSQPHRLEHARYGIMRHDEATGLDRFEPGRPESVS